VTGERLRVAIDARKVTSAESGVGNYTLNLVRHLRAEDPNLELVLVRKSRGRSPALDGLGNEEIPVPFPHDSPFTPLALRYFIRGRRFDVFHSTYELTPRGLDRPLVVTVHDVNWVVNPAYNSNNFFMRRAGGFFYRNSVMAALDGATRVIAISKATRNAILEFAPWHEPKIRVVYNGVDRKRVFPVDPAAAGRALGHLMAPGTPFVLTVGQGSPYKNHFHAVRGFLRAFRDRADYRMVLVRRFAGADRELERLLSTPEARAKVIVLPYVTPEVLNALYNLARIVLHPSYYEGFGLPLVEAMSAGVPVVTSIVSAMPEVVGPAALLVSPADEQAIAGALVRVDREEALRERLIADGRRQLDRFDWTEAARATLAVYREAAGEAARPKE
jgi:glycosyltransferase involved in cell wall biosynthesis